MKSFMLVVLCILLRLAICELDKELGESCDSRKDCAIAYSYCSENKKCECADGFAQTEDGLCAAPWACPNAVDENGHAVVVLSVGGPCEIEYNVGGGRQSIHNCSSNSFCFAHTRAKTSNGKDFGHCCGIPPANVGAIDLVCPLKVTSNGTCPDMSKYPADKVVPEELRRTCSYEMAQCVSQPYRIDHICCPDPCYGVSSHFEIRGRCYDNGLMDFPCKHTAQCGGGSTCKPTKTGLSTCQCEGPVIDEPSPHCDNSFDSPYGQSNSE